MKIAHHRLIFSALIALFSLTVHAQALDSTLAKYAAKYPQEKLYIHYDKSVYAPGETIWFKAYFMEGLYPLAASKNFYLDWIDDNGNTLYHTVSPIVDGTTNGQFDIPADFNGNIIHLRGYTTWMLNFDTAFLYKKDLRIINKNNLKAARPVNVVPSIQFFPEGGDLVADISNKVAFKANDQYGRPVKVRGFVADAKGALVDSIRALHDGMGFLMITPQAGTAYLAHWRDEKGTEHTTPLPETKAEGLSMQVAISGARRYVLVNGSAHIAPELTRLHLLGTMNQTMAFKTDVTLAPGGNARKIIPTENLPSGILTITLFDQNWNAVAERITFVNNHEYFFPTTMDVNRWGLNKRARDEVKITIPDSLQANLSVSVTDASLEADSSDNIISHLLLTGELKGLVYHPAYYFSGTADSLVQNLDLVMLTHGWRRFKWEDIAKGKLPVITHPRDTSYLTFSGKVYGARRGQFGASDNIILLIKSKDTATASRMNILPITADGTFSDPEMIFFDTLRVYYQIKSKANSRADVGFMPARLPAPNYTSLSKTFLTWNPAFLDTTGTSYHFRLSSEKARLDAMQKGKMLEEVTVTARKKSPLVQMDEKYASGMFRSGDGYQFDLLSDKLSASYTNIFQYLQGKVAGLQITTGASTSLTWRGGAPSLYLDEVQTDVDMLGSIPVSDVAYVKVFRPPFMGGFGGSNGAIAIYTRRGGDVANEPGKGLANNMIAGYTPVRQFYAPNYDTFNASNEQADLRTTLYWNPRLTPDPKKHTVTFTFYNNDISKAFRVVIEGMSRDGLLTHLEQTME
jgi:hypothetical protein